MYDRTVDGAGNDAGRKDDLSSLPRIAEPEPEGHSERFDPNEEEILKLVAANTPSHRGAWKRNSKAWQVFVRRQGKNQGGTGGFIPEENEDEAFHSTLDTDDSDSDFHNDQRWNLNAGVPASLPITIGSLKHSKPPLSLASYQQKTSLSDRPGMLVPPLLGTGRSLSSSAFRKASYAERDRSRLMDPGALDFASQGDEDEDESDSEDEPSKIDEFEGGRGRQRAFKILQARSKIPSAGMWRSLA